jgi:hypothetical protein
VCAADIGATIDAGTIAPDRIGIVPNLLGDGFHLTSLSLGSECADKAPDASVPVLATSWSVDDTTNPLSLSQRPQTDPSGNRIDDASASFWWQGYFYALSTTFAAPAPVATGPSAADSRQILLRAIAQLAPGLEVSCFAQRKNGTWTDLSALGIGDPRPAVPAGFSAVDLQLTYLSTPSCAAAPAVDSELWLSATFQNAAEGWIGVNGWSLGGSAPYPGSLQDGFIGWSSDRYQFGVSGWTSDGGPFPANLLLSIAKALDPTFSVECLLQPVVLTPGDLDALGFHSPAAPSGWVETQAFLAGDVVAASCSRAYDFRGTYQLFWTFDGPGALVLTASAYRVVTDHPGPRTDPVIADGCISWSDDRGTSFFVSGYSVSGGSGPDRSVLVAVAQSMDPGLTIPN